MKFGFTNPVPTKKKPRKRSSSIAANAPKRAAQRSARSTSSSSSAPSKNDSSTNNSTTKLNVYGVNWKDLRTDSLMLRDIASCALGSSVHSIADKPDLLLRSLFSGFTLPELMFVAALLNVETISGDKTSLIVEIINTIITKEQRSVSTDVLAPSIVSVSPKKKVTSICDLKK